MNEEEQIYDVGSNVEELGFAYLFFRYVLPIIAGVVLVVILALFLTHFLNLIAWQPSSFQFPH